MFRNLAAYFVSMVGYMSVSFTIKHCPVSTIWFPKFAFMSLAIDQKTDSENTHTHTHTHTHIYIYIYIYIYI